MTARAMLLREIQRYYVDRENVTPSHYGMGMDSRGEYVLYADHEAERNRLLDEIERLKAMVPKWVLKSEAVEPYHFIRHRMVATPEGWDEWWLIAPGEEPEIPLPEKHEEKGSE